jgi:hypothetical protein
MHAQTILQLYRQLIDAGYDDQRLTQVRAAYELARQLFVGCYRPSEKPFCAHLVGTASALARWGQSTEMVVAGLLHSAYLYGDFGDRSRGISSAKQLVVRRNVGPCAEALVELYTESAERRFSFFDLPANDSCSRDIAVLKLADLFDECADAGPLYSPHKQLKDGLPHDATARRQVLALADAMLGTTAKADFVRVFEELDYCRIPEALVNQRVAYHTAQSGLPEMRISQMRRRLLRFAQRLSLW